MSEARIEAKKQKRSVFLQQKKKVGSVSKAGGDGDGAAAATPAVDPRNIKKAKKLQRKEKKKKLSLGQELMEDRIKPMTQDSTRAKESTSKDDKAPVKPKKAKKMTSEESNGDPLTSTGDIVLEEGIALSQAFAPKSAKATSTEESDSTTKNRYLLFVGNLPFDASEEDIRRHFSKIEGLHSVRLLQKRSGEPRGCGFLEFHTPEARKIGLRRHHSKLKNRRINVEVTAGGGGNSNERRQKIHQKNKKFQQGVEKSMKTLKTKWKNQTSDFDEGDQVQSTSVCVSNMGKGREFRERGRGSRSRGGSSGGRPQGRGGFRDGRRGSGGRGGSHSRGRGGSRAGRGGRGGFVGGRGGKGSGRGRGRGVGRREVEAES